MDLPGKMILSFLEEDNIQRSLFLVLPLLTENGVVPASAAQSFPDHGFIRVVPDKNEQYTFKERMKKLGSLCLINLADYAEDASKIRQNRNYSPNRGENHQFIAYSNAVQSLPEQLVYEVVQGKAGHPAPSATTVFCFLREGGRIQGPFRADNGIAEKNTSVIRPDSARLFAISLPNGQEKLFYWPETQAKPEENKVENALTVIQSIDSSLPVLENKLRDNTSFQSSFPQAANKSSGTPIYQVTAKQEMPMRAFNPLNAMVDRFTRKRDEAPSATMDGTASMQRVENPITQLKQQLDRVWQDEETRKQVVDYLIHLPSATALISRRLTNHEDAVQGAMRHQLQDMEAERLALLMQLDKLRADKRHLLEEALADHFKENKKKQEQQDVELKTLTRELETLKTQKEGLLQEYHRALDELQRIGFEPHILPPKGGNDTKASEVIRRICKNMAAAGFDCSKEDALHLLLLLLMHPQVQLATSCAADSVLAAQALSKALGASCVSALDNRHLAVAQGGNAPQIAIRSQGVWASDGSISIIASEHIKPDDHTSYRFSPWPSIRILEGQTSCSNTIEEYPAIDFIALQKEILSKIEPLPEDAYAFLDSVQQALIKQGGALSIALRTAFIRYLSVAALVLDGGIASALDLAFCAWIWPFLLYQGVDLSTLKPLLVSLPRASSLL